MKHSSRNSGRGGRAPRRPQQSRSTRELSSAEQCRAEQCRAGGRRCTAPHCTAPHNTAPPHPQQLLRPEPSQHVPFTGTGRAAGCSRVRQQLVLYRVPGQTFPRSARFKVNGQACGGPGGRLNALPFTVKPAARTHWGARSAHCTSTQHSRAPIRTPVNYKFPPCQRYVFIIFPRLFLGRYNPRLV